jgi:hypothetical protein
VAEEEEEEEEKEGGRRAESCVGLFMQLRDGGGALARAVRGQLYEVLRAACDLKHVTRDA